MIVFSEFSSSWWFIKITIKQAPKLDSKDCSVITLFIWPPNDRNNFSLPSIFPIGKTMLSKCLVKKNDVSSVYFLCDCCSYLKCERIFTKKLYLSYHVLRKTINFHIRKEFPLHRNRPSQWAGIYKMTSLSWCGLSETHGNFTIFILIYFTHEIYLAGLSRQDQGVSLLQ